MTQSGNGQNKDANPNDIDVYEKIPQDNPAREPDWFKENLATGEREVVPAEDAPKELEENEDNPQG
ncbi:MAG: hypothetical protein HWQ38_24205 [Nostoc sp. NMS7]|uniref:hypothetical protein n=1 Tax=Nostoc sp. NMS7 TaxID=2815391 RepID=UPI0025FBADBD|nr:hypothetical protein [Nostoc sp. NMS7]MBN3949397.1 hypothetical protein [Nostoc sp. NMS7]